MDNFTITPLYNQDCRKIVDLVIPIQQLEFNLPVTLEGQPDILDVEAFYHRDGGCFWGARKDDEIIGTIGLFATGHQAGAIRKMFVKKEFRGKQTGVAQELLKTLILFSVENQITDLYLGTVDLLKAAHRFYERNGFTRKKKEEMPFYFPVMAWENVYYHLKVKDVLHN